MVVFQTDELVIEAYNRQYVVGAALELDRSATLPNELEIKTIWPVEQAVDSDGFVLLLSQNPALRTKIAVEIEKMFYSVGSGLYEAAEAYWTFVYGTEGKSA